MKRKESREMEALRERVETWRQQGGGRGSLIPEELWNGAVRVAGINGMWATSRALQFNYERLRKRVDGAKGSEDRGSKVSAALALPEECRPVGYRERASGGKAARFVSLDMGALGGAPKTVIDLISEHGDRMRVEVPSGSVDVVSLVDRFWSAAP